MNNTMKRLFLLLAVLCVSLSSFSDETTTRIKLTDSERQLVQNNNQFALSLFGKVRDGQRTTDNRQWSMFNDTLAP